MKKLNFKVVMAFVAGLFLFSCSNEDDILTQVSPDTGTTLSAEDAAFQDLVGQFNALNAEYGVGPETRIVDGGTGEILSPSMLRIVSSDVLGTVLAIRTNVPKAVVTSVITSVRAFTKSTENIKPVIDLWVNNNHMASYLSTIGTTASGEDAMGDIHNKMVQQLYDKYGIALVNMSDSQLQTAVCEAWGTFSFVPAIDNINFTGINDIIKTNDYAQSLNKLYLNRTLTKNEFDLMSSFLIGLNKVPTRDLLSYCAGARQLVYYSSIAPTYREYLCAAVSIGFASRHLWK